MSRFLDLVGLSRFKEKLKSEIQNEQNVQISSLKQQIQSLQTQINDINSSFDGVSIVVVPTSETQSVQSDVVTNNVQSDVVTQDLQGEDTIQVFKRK